MLKTCHPGSAVIVCLLVLLSFHAFSIPINNFKPALSPLQVTESSSLVISTFKTSANIKWISGGGTARAVFVSAGTTGQPTLQSNTSYTANASMGSGTTAGTGWFCVYNGTGSGCTVNNLTPGTSYRVAVVEYIGAAGQELYQGTFANSNVKNFKTMVNAPQLNLGINGYNLTLGQAITPIVINNSGGVVPGRRYAQTSTVYTGSNQAYYWYMAADANGSILFADNKNLSNYYYRTYTPQGSVSTTTVGSTGISGSNGFGVSTSQPAGIAVDSSKNVYLLDSLTNVVIKYTPGSGYIKIGSGVSGYADGDRLAAKFSVLRGITSDGINVFVIDKNRIRKIAPDGTVSTLAGSDDQATLDGTGANAHFNAPQKLSADKNGNLYTVEGGKIIRKITPQGVVTTKFTSIDARTVNPVVDNNGKIYVGYGYSICKIDSTGSLLTSLAGIMDTYGDADGIGSNAKFRYPTALAMNADGYLYEGDFANQKLKRIATTGYDVSTLPAGLTFDPVTGTISGTPTAASSSTVYAITGYNESGQSTVTFTLEVGLKRASAVTFSGVESTKAKISWINGGGTARVVILKAGTLTNPYTLSNNTTYAVNTSVGPGNTNYVCVYDGTGSSVNVTNLAPNTTYSVMVFEYTGTRGHQQYQTNALVKTFRTSAPAPKLSVESNSYSFVVGQVIKPINIANAGGVVPAVPYAGVSTFTHTNTSSNLHDMSTDAAGNLYLIDTGGIDRYFYKKITPSGTATTTLIGQAPAFSGTVPAFGAPAHIAVDSSNTVYIADSLRHLIVKYNPSQPGTYTTIGDGTDGLADGTQNIAQFKSLSGLTTDGINLYVLDGNRVRKVTPDGNVTTLAGSGTSATVDGTGMAASFNKPYKLSIDKYGNLYTSDDVLYGRSLRRISPAGVVTTLYLSGGANEHMYSPVADSKGMVLVANGYKVSYLDSVGHQLLTFAGSDTHGSKDTIGKDASFYYPSALTLKNNDQVYIADIYNKAIRTANITGYKVSPSLPAGLSFDYATATITGKPTGAINQATYAITAYNESGQSTVNISLMTGPAQISNLAFSPVAYSKEKISWNNGSGSARAVFISTAPTGNPTVQNNTTYTANASYGAGTTAGTGWYCIYNGTDSSFTVNSLALNTAYRVAVVQYNGAAGQEQYQDIFTGENVKGFKTAVAGSPLLSVPANSYTFTKDQIITPIVVSNNGAAVPLRSFGQTSSVYTAGPVFAYPGWSMAPDGTGNVLFLDAQNLTTYYYRTLTPQGTVITTTVGPNVTGNIGSSRYSNNMQPTGIAVDSSKNVYLLDSINNVVIKYTPRSGFIKIGSGISGYADGDRLTAKFSSLGGLTSDGTNAYVTDGNRIRKIAPDGTVSTLAGNDNHGTVDGIGTNATFYAPQKISADKYGNLYTVDNGSVIRKITPQGVASTLYTSPDDLLVNPVVDNAGDLYVAHRYAIFKLDTITHSLNVLAGSSDFWGYGSFDGTGTSATFNYPSALAINVDGYLYEGDVFNKKLRKVSITGYSISPALPAGLTFNMQTGVISGRPTVAAAPKTYTITAKNYTGSSTVNVTLEINTLQVPIISYSAFASLPINVPITAIKPVNTGGAVPQTVYANVTTIAGGPGSGAANGTGAAASFNNPLGLAFSITGDIYVADNGNNLIRKVTKDGVVTTFAGSGSVGSANGTGTLASFNGPGALVFNPDRNLFVADGANQMIRIIDQSASVNTFAGAPGYPLFDLPAGIAVYQNILYLADYNRHKIYSVGPGGYVTTFAGIALVKGKTDGNASTATFNNPQGLAVDRSGNLYVADRGNYLIRKITPDGNVTTYAGNGIKDVVNGPVATASFADPVNLAFDVAGNLYVTDAYSLIRKISPDGQVSTLAGKYPGTATKDGVGTSAELDSPFGIVVDPQGILYFSNRNSSNSIRKIALTGYTISPALPAGLIFDSATGIISGTPTTASPSTEYTITAHNAAGESSTQITFAVGKTMPVITFNPLAQVTYGDADALLQASSTNTVNPVKYRSDQVGVATIVNGKIHITGAGTAHITASQTGTGIYADADSITQTLTVKPRNLTIAADTLSKTYGGNDPKFTYKIKDGSLINGDTISGTLQRTAGENAGKYTVDKGSLAINANYTINFIKGLLIVNKATLTLTANDQRRLYLSPNPTLTVKYEGFVNGDDVSKLTTLPIVSTTATQSSLPGNYPVIPSGGAAANYDLSYKPGTLIIDPVSITFDPIPAKKYGDPDFTISTNSASPVTFTTSDASVATVTGNKVHIVNAGSVKIAASNNGGSVTTWELTIGKAPLTVTANDQRRFYLSPNPSFTVKYDGFLPGDDAGKLITLPTATTVATQLSGTGTYAITPSGGSANNYTLTYKPGNLVIDAVPVTFGQIPAKTYADADFDLPVNSAIPVTILTSDANVASVTGTKVHISGAGSVTMTATNGSATTTAQLVVSKMPLTVTADNATRIYGKSDPEFTATYSGFVKGDTPNFLTAQPSVTTAATSASAPGTYDLIPVGGASRNYDFVYKKGTLTIAPAATNLKVSASSVTCKGEKNGLISVVAARQANYTAVLTGSGINKNYTFITTLNIDNLAPGAYNLCVTDAAVPGYPQCFELTITEPKDLAVYSTVNKTTGTITLALNGGDHYQVNLNGTVYQTGSNSITLPLDKGSNKLTVTTDRLCQGLIEKVINLSDNHVPYPNPFTDKLYINLGDQVVHSGTVKIYNMTSGGLKLSQTISEQSGVVSLDVIALPIGVYSLNLVLDGKETIYKITKQ